MSRSRVEFDEREFVREAAPPRRAPVREYDDYRDPARVPAFMLREERPTQAGQLVLRQREIETMERQRPRSPSPEVRLRERFVQRARSVSPGPRRVEEDIRIRQVERTREPSRAPSERIRYVERPRSPSPSIHERIRITDRREERRSPSPAPPPPPPQPQVIKGPTIEREVITHYRDIDHGMVVARPPSPPPQRHEHRDTEIDIYTSRKGTEVGIHKHTHSHSRGRSVERPSRPIVHAYDDDLVVSTDRKHLHVDIERRRSLSRGRRAHSAAPPVIDYDDEAYEIKSRIDARGKMGEAWNGITKDWTIVDVPPGTERVRMDGAGGASAEVTWQKFSGVRRAKFIPDRDEKSVVSATSTTISDSRDRDRDREIERERRLSVQIIDKDRRDRDRDGDYEKVTDRRLTISKSRTNSPAPPQRRSETWTEITKDLVCREAIQEMGYEYEETEYFYYIIDFLAHDEVVRLVNLSDRIRQSRKDRAREIQYEREWRDEWEHRHHHHHSHSHSSSRHRLDDERVVEREIIYDSHRHPRQYRY